MCSLHSHNVEMSACCTLHSQFLPLPFNIPLPDNIWRRTSHVLTSIEVSLHGWQRKSDGNHRKFWMTGTIYHCALLNNGPAKERTIHCRFGFVSAGHGVLIGPGATLLGGIHIGCGTKIGAGTVVVSDLPSHSIAVGVPARIIKTDRDGEPVQDMDQCSDIALDYEI